MAADVFSDLSIGTDDNLVPIPGAKWKFYDTGTSTPRAVYSNATLATSLGSVVTADGDGRFVPIYFNADYLYRAVLTDASDVTIKEIDPANAGVNSLLTDLASIVQGEGSGLVGYYDGTTVEAELDALNATTTDLQSRVSIYVSVRDYGAVGDGVTDDSASIQAAFDAMESVDSDTPDNGRIIYFPRGEYLVETSVKAYSGIHIVGDGNGSRLVAGASLTSHILELASNDVADQYRYASVRNIGFTATGTIWGIKATASLVLNSVFQDLTFDIGFGVELATYTQACVLMHWVSVGPLNQLLKLTGNINLIESMDKEGSTGSTSDPYILSTGAAGSNDGNIWRKILLEGSGHASKTPIKFVNATSTVLDGYWFEASTSDGTAITFDASVVTVRGDFKNILSASVISIQNESYVRIDYLNAASEDVLWQSYFDISSDSYCEIETLRTRRGSSLVRIDTMPNLRALSYIDQTLLGTPDAGFYPISRQNYASGQNLLVNPSFEAGMYSWGISSADTPSFPTSSISKGLMFQCTTSTGFVLEQTFSVSAGQVGTPVTIRYMVKITGSGYVIPYIASDANTGADRVNYGDGWVAVSRTYTLQSSGTLGFGIWALGVSGSATVYVDEVSVAFGTEALMNPAKFGSIELKDGTVTRASAAPASGTWKQGDIVFNDAPTSGGAAGWMCTAAGSPGTWKAMANLA